MQPCTDRCSRDVRRRALALAQWGFVLAASVYATAVLRGQWHAVRYRLDHLTIEPWYLLAASALVLSAYAVLIETWRRVLNAWDRGLQGRELGWRTSARIWFASNLGKYIPGSIWAIAALGAMARQNGASAISAAGSSLLVNLLNLASGLAIVILFGAQLIPHAAAFAVVAAVTVAGALAAPVLLPVAVRLLASMTGREITFARIPASTVWLSLAGTSFAWLAYGLAFRAFAVSLLGGAAVHGSVVLPVAAYTAAYIVGFVAFFAPAGLGVREIGIIEGLPLLGVTSHSDAVILAVTSRLWLTVLEIIPGLVALAAGHSRPRKTSA